MMDKQMRRLAFAFKKVSQYIFTQMFNIHLTNFFTILGTQGNR